MLYVDGIFVQRVKDKDVIIHLASQIEEHPEYICHYAGVFDDPYEIVDMIIRRKMTFQDARLISEITINDKVRYIFNGNISGVSCAFRFTMFDLDYVEKLKQYITDNKKTSKIKISLLLESGCVA